MKGNSMLVQCVVRLCWNPECFNRFAQCCAFSLIFSFFPLGTRADAWDTDCVMEDAMVSKNP